MFYKKQAQKQNAKKTHKKTDTFTKKGKGVYTEFIA